MENEDAVRRAGASPVGAATTDTINALNPSISIAEGSFSGVCCVWS